ncbi:MAG: hypothetical protein K8U57_33070 [Planctomycetes bacterium]|nr:hypothetical protein [Planctomycetota bacterium]
MRILVLGVAVVCALSAWAWTRPCATEAHAQGAGEVVSAEEMESSAGGNKDEALARYRCNGSRHWKQVVLSR